MLFLSQGDTGEAGPPGNPGHKVGYSLRQVKNLKFPQCCFALRAVIVMDLFGKLSLNYFFSLIHFVLVSNSSCFTAWLSDPGSSRCLSSFSDLWNLSLPSLRSFSHIIGLNRWLALC